MTDKLTRNESGEYYTVLNLRILERVSLVPAEPSQEIPQFQHLYRMRPSQCFLPTFSRIHPHCHLEEVVQQRRTLFRVDFATFSK